jgi:hypothetical protein
MVVSELLSSEYPIEATVCDEHAEAFAERTKGELTTSPFCGLATVTAADAGAAHAIKVEMRKAQVFMSLPFRNIASGCELRFAQGLFAALLSAGSPDVHFLAGLI